MTNSRKIVKVFLASPGDMKPEREAAKQVVDDFNKEWADHLGVHVELVGWEDTVSRFGRPQELINRDLDQCEVFIGMIWKHWGSPPDNEGKYTSGFEEEFDRSVTSRKGSGRPEISLLFKEVDPELLKDPGEALRRVLAFKDKIVTEKIVLFENFSNIREFENKVRGCITRYIQGVRAEEAQRISDDTNARASDGVQSEKVAEVVTAYTPLSAEGAQFLRGFVTKTERDRGTNPILPEEVARFRLLGGLVSSSGNDDATVGVHDANILFAKRSEINFSRREMDGLIDGALENLPQQNVPLWHWYTAAEAETRGYLSLVAFIGFPALRIGALNAMRFLGEPIEPPSFLEGGDEKKGREIIVASWFADGGDDRLRVAALEYLGVCGENDDLSVVRKEYDRGNYQTVGPATQALIRLSLKQSREDAIKVLFDLQPESVDSELIGQLFDKPAGIETSLLARGATHRSPQVRKTVVPLLVSRKVLDTSVSEQLLSDSDAVVRYWALRSLIISGREYSDEKAREILVRPTNRGGFGLFGTTGVPDSEGEKQYQRYLKEKLRKLDNATLERLMAAESVFEKNARLALDFKRFSTRASLLRKSVDNEFKDEFESDLKALEERLGSESDTVKRTRPLESHIRKGFTRKGLDVLCEKNDPKDLERVRAALANQSFEYSQLDVEYLRRHGEWQDVSLLISFSERASGGGTLSLLMSSDDDRMQNIADAISVIARGRIADLLVMKMPDRLRALILTRFADKEIIGLKDDEIMKHLFSANDRIRKVMAIKVIRSFSKKRLKSLLGRYMEAGEHRYYNVIYWLDMGISLPKVKVSQATAPALSKEW